MKRLTATAVLFAACAALPAQTCNPGELLVKNDGLPDVPSGATAVGLFPGLCDGQPVTVGLLQGCFPGGQVTPAQGEAMVFVLDVSTWVSFNVTRVAVMAAHATGSPGLVFSANLEIYDGVTGGPGSWQLGNLLFDLAAATGNSVQLTTHAINTIDVSPYGITTTTGALAVALRLEFNLNGTCTSFFGTSAGFACDLLGTTPQGKNFIDGFDVCTGNPQPTLLDLSTVGGPYFSGNWIGRVCGVPGALANPRVVTFLPSAQTFAGQPALVLFQGVPADAGLLYVPVFSCTGGTTPLAGTPFVVPLVFDACTPLAYDPAFTSIVSLAPPGQPFGVLNPLGQATGIVTVPFGITLQFPLYFAFGVVGGGTLQGISNVGVLNVN